MENREQRGRVLIECPNTIFHLYVDDENDMSKIEIFMNNIRRVKRLSLNDIYHWCNCQGIAYETRFNYHKDFSLWRNMRSYMQYFRHKRKYQVSFGAA